jgi:hypothetical protein
VAWAHDDFSFVPDPEALDEDPLPESVLAFDEESPDDVDDVDDEGEDALESDELDSAFSPEEVLDEDERRLSVA